MADRVVFDEVALAELFRSTEGPVGKLLARKSIAVERAAKRMAPVDTGRLRSSITHDIGRDELGLAARVGTDVHYAIYLEFGTRRMRPRPFLRPALNAARTTR